MINSIMPMSDLEAQAANGQKLRVAVTKTSAQGKAAQSATPNLMSFSTDENSIWFNGKMYGVHKFNNVSSLDTNSTAEQVLSALNVSKSSELYDLAHKGILFIDTISGNTIVKYEDGDDTFQLYVPSSDSRSIKKLTITVSSNKVTGLTTVSHLIVDDIRNTLTSTETNKALSAAMGKKLNDEKLAKTDVVDNLTTTDTSKALSAAQGKALNDKFNGNKININLSAASNSTDNATIKGYMGNIDGTTLVNKLTYGANLVDSSSEDWVITLQEVSATKVVFVGLKLQSFRIATRTVTVTISGSNYTNMAVITADRYVPNVVNDLTSSDTANALSAAQGKALNDKISALGSVYRIKGSKTNISEVLALTDARVGDVWNVINAFTFGGKPYPANTNIVCITATSTSDHDENNWDPLGGTVDLSTYVSKSDIVDNTTSSYTNKPLSANQGRLLGARLDKLEVKTDLYKLLKPFTSGTLGSKTEVDSLLGVYSTFSSAVTTGKLIYGIYNDSSSLTHTVTFTAYNITSKKQVIMYAVIDPTTMVRISADYEGTNWVTATIEQGVLGEGTIIE